MEINNFIIFIIILLLSIVLYKSAKIFNYNKKNNFENYIDSTTDSTFIITKGAGYKIGMEDSIRGSGLLTDTSYEDCKDKWESCKNISPNICQRQYSGNCMIHTESENCTPDRDNCDISTYLDSTNNIIYDVIKSHTIIHKKRDKINEDFSIQTLNEDNLSDGDIDKNISSEPLVEYDRLQNLMPKYQLRSSPDNEFIGIILERYSNEKTSFYPIFIDDNSSIDIEPDNNIINRKSNLIDSTVYIKKDINCRGKWSPCTFTQGSDAQDIVSQESKRTYFVNYPGRGSGSECINHDETTELCASWGNCIYNEDEESNKRTWNIHTTDICNEQDDKCFTNITSPTTDGCTQPARCVVRETKNCDVFLGTSGDAGHEGINRGDTGKYVNIENSGSSIDGRKSCRGYEDGKFYVSRMEKNQNGSGYIKRDCNTEDTSKILNCMCDDREQHSIECSKEYIFYWGRDWRTDENKGLNEWGEPKNILDENSIDRDNELHQGKCFAYVKNLTHSTQKWKEENPDLPSCPAHIDEYDDDGNKIGKKRVFQDSYSSTNSKIGNEQIPSYGNGMIIDVIQEAKNLDSNSYNTENEGITDENQFIEFEKRPNPYSVEPSGADGSAAQYWGELCKEYGIYPQNCVKSAPYNKNNCPAGYTGHKKYVNISVPKKYNGFCSITDEDDEKFLSNHCNKIVLRRRSNPISRARSWARRTFGGL